MGVEPADSMITIKRVFRKLALKLHPDVNKTADAHERFIELNEAFQVLGNPLKRKRYDQLYHVQVLQKEPTKDHIYKNKKEFWENSVRNTARKGNTKGERRATKSQKKSSNRFWGSNILFDLVAELVWEILSFIFSSITD